MHVCVDRYVYVLYIYIHTCIHSHIMGGYTMASDLNEDSGEAYYSLGLWVLGMVTQKDAVIWTAA